MKLHIVDTISRDVVIEVQHCYELAVLQNKIDMIQDALVKRRCHDHNCAFGHPGGMGTNGGCHIDHLDKYELRKELKNLLLEIREMLK